ncbi:MAG: hypothetical protein ACMUJM_20605 [bacterium]
MIKFLSIAIFIIALVLIISIVRSNIQLKKHYDGPEAIQWLKNNKNPYALASNHFTSTKAAITFVEKLYSEGAEFIKIAKDCIKADTQTVKEEGGPYADGLVVKLPSDKAKRKVVISICRDELDPEFKDSIEKDVRFDMIYLWWD